MSILGQGILQMIFVLGAFTGIGNIRMVRGVVMTIKENDYVMAAKAMGCSTWRILIKHILPQIWPPIIVVFTVNVGAVMLSEATISFLGFGIAPPQPSWGSMLSMEGRKYMETAPLLALLPGFCLAIVVYGINMFGDAMRDLLDPRLRGTGFEIKN
jgi:peptide/nickel transport system permease protein